MIDTKGKVYIVGGGPGDPELLTLKAKRIIETADVVIFADSLVPPEIVEFAKEGAEVHGSKELNLDQIMELELAAVREGKIVARVQSGDPSIYGAILEQMRVLEEEGIEFEIIPGVSAAFAAAAVLKSELTVPEKSQTVILTRMEGRVAMPPGEQLKDFRSRMYLGHIPKHNQDDQGSAGTHIFRRIHRRHARCGGLPRRLAGRVGHPGHFKGHRRQSKGRQDNPAGSDHCGRCR